ncbi:MAG TPA: UDP-3-O-(3-hydroxymyristoyl)glucosamine N-acyltransferase [Candidatus Krumholzibacteria bacterium]|nr:UDP-3-O-(3-hydroxymyristoyl)glucosamine N-acyltransferase [Candidatus Krumholzibacteria bacterium]
MQIDLKTLAERVGGRLDGPADLMVRGLAGIRDAEAGDCTFVADPRYQRDLASTRASAVILGDGLECSLPAIRVADAAVAFARALAEFAPKREDLFPPGIDTRAFVDPDARLGEDVHIGPFAVVGPGCRVGDRAVIGAGSVLMAGVTLGGDALLYPRVVIREHCRVGDRVIVHAGAVIGSDGFGYAREGAAVHKIPQIGNVVIEEDVEIGANACIDRATTGETVIGAGSKLDNLVQVGHNVQIGRRTAISAQTGISGSCSIGDDVIFGGQAGVADHLRIGDRVRVAAKAGVSGSVADEATVAGYPARDHSDWKRIQARLSRLSQYAEEISRLKRRVDDLENA